jgi:hypothetical protein
MLLKQMNRKLRAIVGLAIAGALLADPAAAGVIITVRNTDAATGQKRSQRTLLSGDLVRTEEGNKASIARADLGKIYELSSRGPSCVEYSASDLALLRQKAQDEKRRMLESAAASAPTPDAQACLSSMVAEKLSRSFRVSYRKLGSVETLGKWKCERLAKDIEGVMVSEVCVVPLSALKLKRSDLAGLTEAGGVFGAAPSTWDQETLSLLENAQSIGYEAFPVEITVFDGSGHGRFISQLAGVALAKIPAKAFQPPTGCTPATALLSSQ